MRSLCEFALGAPRDRPCRLAYVRALRAANEQDFDKFAARAAPAIFVLLWSTGFVGTKYVVNNADPLTYLAIRMVFVVGVDGSLSPSRGRNGRTHEIGHSIVAGILVHGFYLGGTAVAISLSFRRACRR